MQKLIQMSLAICKKKKEMACKTIYFLGNQYIDILFVWLNLNFVHDSCYKCVPGTKVQYTHHVVSSPSNGNVYCIFPNVTYSTFRQSIPLGNKRKKVRTTQCK